MLLEGNSVKSTDIVESASMGDNLSKHQLISLFSLPRDETFISPELLAKVKSFGPNIFKWHRYKFSGRSFAKGFMYDEQLYDFVVKGGHLLEKGEIRDPKKIFIATPAWGSETVLQLYNEFCTVHAIQNISLEATGALAPIPIPLKVSRLDTYKYKGDIENYREFMGYIFASSEFHQNNMLCIMVEKKMGIHMDDPIKEGKFQIKEEFCSFEKLFEVYWRNIGDHGSYQYICQGTSMRLADVFQSPTKTEMQHKIRSFYPGSSDREICAKFMQNLGKARGSIYGSGYHYKPGRIDNCFLVDTTIMGNAMDIEGYAFHEKNDNNQREDMIKKHWIYAEMSYMFYHLFFAADFLGFYRENFISSFVKTFVGIYDRRMMKQEGMKRRYALDHAQNMLSNCFFEESKVYIERILKTGEIRSSPKYLGNILECIDNTIPFTKGT